MGSGNTPCPSAFGDHGPEGPCPAQLEIPCQPLHGGWLLQIAGICITEHWREQTVLEALPEDNHGLKGSWLDKHVQAPHSMGGERFSLWERSP